MLTDTMRINKQFYEEAAAPMISRQFPAYESRIAVGVAGEGSDCFGFDDAISRDHDFGVVAQCEVDDFPGSSAFSHNVFGNL